MRTQNTVPHVALVLAVSAAAACSSAPDGDAGSFGEGVSSAEAGGR